MVLYCRATILYSYLESLEVIDEDVWDPEVFYQIQIHWGQSILGWSTLHSENDENLTEEYFIPLRYYTRQNIYFMK